MTDEELVTCSQEEFDAHWDKIMDATSTVYSLRPGHTLTQADYDAIQEHDRYYRENDEAATTAFHRGYMQGLREGGSAEIEELHKRIDKQFVEKGTQMAMRMLAEQRAAKLLAALQALDCSDILGVAESCASGQPRWDHVSAKINAARALLSPPPDAPPPASVPPGSAGPSAHGTEHAVRQDSQRKDA